MKIFKSLSNNFISFHPRVLYIDIDIHHGDGVQEAFYNSNRVMTVSFHKYTGDFFPGTGSLQETGQGNGKHFCLNVPLQDGIDDYSYVALFKNIMSSTIESYRPSAILLQCGADSLGCDRLGAFNLSIKAHGECVQYIKSWGIPLMVVGGGGYTIRNVSRCWTYETSVLLDMGVNDTLPQTCYDEYFAPDYVLHPPIVTKVENQNSRPSLERLVISCREQLRYLNGAPSVQMQEIPPDILKYMDSSEQSLDEKLDEEYGVTNGKDVKEKDEHSSKNEFFDDDNDNDRMDELVIEEEKNVDKDVIMKDVEDSERNIIENNSSNTNDDVNNNNDDNNSDHNINKNNESDRDSNDINNNNHNDNNNHNNTDDNNNNNNNSDNIDKNNANKSNHSNNINNDNDNINNDNDNINNNNDNINNSNDNINNNNDDINYKDNISNNNEDNMNNNNNDNEIKIKAEV